MNNYVFSGGDGQARSNIGGNATTPGTPRPNRGLFGAYICYGIRDCIDGTSNTIAMSERVRPTAVDAFGNIHNNIGSEVPAVCRAIQQPNKALPAGTGYNADTITGFRWADGAHHFAGFNTTIPPNGPSCFTNGGGHWDLVIATASSRHVGGVQVLMADGAVRFISENIDAGNQSVTLPGDTTSGVSPYGVWGALGTRAGGEVVGEF
jgi:prepilin-type processing-associated H-X9-DG protein